MNTADYKPYLTAQTLMGPNSVRILEELLHAHPLPLAPGSALLDLGCGKGLTSLVLANETPAQVVAADLWIGAEENAARFAAWGCADRVRPVHADANALPFAPKTFHALVSVDAYHYFGTGAGFFTEKILPFLQDGATVLIGIPGVKDEFADRAQPLLAPWLGEETYMFQSPAKWQAIIGSHSRIARVHTWEMACFDNAWADWFATGHEYAHGDRQVFESIIRPYTCFVGICVKLNESDE